MKRRGRRRFAHADDHHLREAALHRPGEAGVQLDAIEHEHAGRFVGDAVHPHVAGRNGAELHDVHRRADRHAHRLFGDAERFDHRPLAFGRAAVVRAHRGEQERPGAVVAEPVAGGAYDGRDVGDAAAAGRDADVAPRHRQAERIELRVDGGADIGDWIRDQFLMDAEKFHCRFNYSEKPRIFVECLVAVDAWKLPRSGSGRRCGHGLGRDRAEDKTCTEVLEGAC